MAMDEHTALFELHRSSFRSGDLSAHRVHLDHGIAPGLPLQRVDDRRAVRLVFYQQRVELPRGLKRSQSVKGVIKAHPAVDLIQPVHRLLCLQPHADANHVGASGILEC